MSSVDYFIGEALLGDGEEVAHIDLLIGDKNGPVGIAFANGLSQLSKGHTPVLGCVRPNMLAKPATLIVPKVTVEDLNQANLIFGPAQAAVSKAVLDSLEEGVIKTEKMDSWVIIASVFIHPKAKDYRKIFQYNYGATKLAIKRALKNYPDLKKIWFDMNRAIHPIAGMRVSNRLFHPPYLQIALDAPDWESITKVIKSIPASDRIILEAGTPLIKRYGIDICKKIRELAPNSFIIADLKTLDVGKVEVDFSFNATADACVVSGLASNETIANFLKECQRTSILSAIDMMEVANPLEKLTNLKSKGAIPDIVIFHRGIDTEETKKDPKLAWSQIKDIKELYKADAYISGRERVLVAVAGGLDDKTSAYALEMKADILIIGRFITGAKDVERATRNILNVIPGDSDIDVKRLHSDDDEEAKKK